MNIKVAHHAGGKWIIHCTEHRKEVAMPGTPLLKHTFTTLLPNFTYTCVCVLQALHMLGAIEKASFVWWRHATNNSVIYSGKIYWQYDSCIKFPSMLNIFVSSPSSKRVNWNLANRQFLCENLCDIIRQTWGFCGDLFHYISLQIRHLYPSLRNGLHYNDVIWA